MALYQQLPFFNPTVEFISPIQGGLLEGMSIIVCGQVLPEAEKFQVDLHHGSDIVFQFNPRYNGESGSVIHNTLQKNSWGEEEIKPQTPFPRGQLFALQILVTLSSYQISANGKAFSEYKHRMPFSDVDSVRVNGMVALKLVAFQYLAPNLAAAPESFTVPYKSIIHGGVQLGKVIIIHGVINPQGLDNRMEIFLRYRTGIAFYYSPRFDENVIVSNSYKDGKWGEQKQSHELELFKRGQPLQLTICSSRHHFKVFVNGQESHSYSHNYIKMEEIDVLEISGDVQLSFVQA